MQRNALFDYYASVLLDQVIKTEKSHLGKRLLTLEQRFNLSLNMMKKLKELHERGVFLGRISIQDLMVQKHSSNDSVIVSIRIPAHANKATNAINPQGWEPYPALIYELDIANQSADSATDVCLFGRIFLDLWRVVGIDNGIDELNLLTKGKVPNAFPSNFLTSDALKMLHELLVAMNAPKRETRPTVNEVMTKLRAIEQLDITCKFGCNNTKSI